MKDKKLIRGIIYDNPNVVEEKTFETVDTLCEVTDAVGKFYDELFQGKCACPTKDEFIVSSVIDAVCNPLSGEENLIIPASLLDNKLYGNLKRIDIGDQLCHAYIEVREEDFLDKCEKEGINPVPMFDSDEDKVNHIVKTTGKRPNIQLKKVNIA